MFSINHPQQNETIRTYFAAHGVGAAGPAITGRLLQGTTLVRHGTVRCQPPDWVIEFENAPPGGNYALEIHQAGAVLGRVFPFTIAEHEFSGEAEIEAAAGTLRITYPSNNGGPYCQSQLVCYGPSSDALDPASFATFAVTANILRDGPFQFMVQFLRINGPGPATLTITNRSGGTDTKTIPLQMC